MSKFEPINTQEEFENALRERLEQKERSVAKKFEGYTSPEDLKKIKEDYDAKISSLNAQIETAKTEAAKKFEGYTSPKDLESIKSGYETKIAKYETDSVKTRIAIDMGIPLELKDRLKGNTEDEIREDAKLLSSFAASKRKPPLASLDVSVDNIDEARLNESVRQMVKNL
ncbi:MAG: hypothetical protein ACLRT4_18120 [Thomasclavelia sp.]